MEVLNINLKLLWFALVWKTIYIMKTISYMKKHKANEFYIKKSRGYYMVIDGYDNSMASLEATEEAANKMVAELNKMRGNRLNIV